MAKFRLNDILYCVENDVFVKVDSVIDWGDGDISYRVKPLREHPSRFFVTKEIDLVDPYTTNFGRYNMEMVEILENETDYFTGKHLIKFKFLKDGRILTTESKNVIKRATGRTTLMLQEIVQLIKTIDKDSSIFLLGVNYHQLKHFQRYIADNFKYGTDLEIKNYSNYTRFTIFVKGYFVSLYFITQDFEPTGRDFSNNIYFYADHYVYDSDMVDYSQIMYIEDVINISRLKYLEKSHVDSFIEDVEEAIKKIDMKKLKENKQFAIISSFIDFKHQFEKFKLSKLKDE